MRLHPCTVAAVLAAFVTTTAVPGRQVVVHSHADGAHAHAHDALAHEALAPHEHDGDDGHVHHHADDHHHHHETAHHEHHDDHHLRLTQADHDPFEHTHVTSPFQPAAPPAPPTVIADVLVTEPGLTSPSEPAARRPGRARSRAPPSSARV